MDDFKRQTQMAGGDDWTERAANRTYDRRPSVSRRRDIMKRARLRLRTQDRQQDQEE